MAQEQIERINETLQLVKQFVDSPEVQKLKEERGFEEYKKYIIRIFPLFYEDFPSLVDMVIEGRDTTFINRMFDALVEIDKGGNKEDVEKKLGEELAEIYLYPKIGKPPKKN